MISLTGRSKAAKIAALLNNARAQGIGVLEAFFAPVQMTEEQAGELLKRQTRFDYLGGRVLKVDLSGDSLDPCLYDRDNGDGAAQRAIESVPIVVEGESR